MILGRVRYDIENEELVDSSIEFQHKMHCWTVSMLAGKDYDDATRFMIMFYLNAYPNVKVGGY